MPPHESEKDVHAAARALGRWLQSQDLDPIDAIPVLINVLCWALFSVANKNQKAAEAFLDLIALCLREEMKEWTTNK